MGKTISKLLGRTPSRRGSFFSRNSKDLGFKAEVLLLPHEHTIFCERKHRVCTAEGRLQELETLSVGFFEDGNPVDEIDVESITWLRSGESESRSRASTLSSVVSHDDINMDSGNLGQDYNQFQEVAGQHGREYQLSVDDIGRFLTCKCTVTRNGTRRDLYSRTCLGPIVPGPPRLHEGSLQIQPSSSTTGFTVGASIRATAKYVGGTEGASEYWWIRVKNGKRECVSEPVPVPCEETFAKDATNSVSDPRVYLVRPSDQGWTLKVKCRPVRNDGVRGDIVTSLPSPSIE